MLRWCRKLLFFLLRYSSHCRFLVALRLVFNPFVSVPYSLGLSCPFPTHWGFRVRSLLTGAFGHHPTHWGFQGHCLGAFSKVSSVSTLSGLYGWCCWNIFSRAVIYWLFFPSLSIAIFPALIRRLSGPSLLCCCSSCHFSLFISSWSHSILHPFLMLSGI